MKRTAIILLLASSLPGQAPVVGDINFYGLRKVSASKILTTAKLAAGSPLPPSRAEMEEKIGEIPGVVLARVEAVCCDGPEAILFIGVEERGAPHAAFRSAPSGEAVLPKETLNTYQQFLGAVQRAASRGNAVEDLSAGHSMMADPEARAYQEQLAAFARENVELLRSVVRTGSQPDQRAAAAAIIGYAPRKADVLNDLQFALQDPDESVRANAVRALNAIAVLASRQPSLGIAISPTWYIEMLNSIVLSDRVESAKALLTLTDGSNPQVLAQVRERALPALGEMARWKTPRYALPAYLLLGRLGGMTDRETQQAWREGKRDTVIDRALKSPNSPRRR